MLDTPEAKEFALAHWLVGGVDGGRGAGMGALGARREVDFFVPGLSRCDGEAPVPPDRRSACIKYTVAPFWR